MDILFSIIICNLYVNTFLFHFYINTNLLFLRLYFHLIFFPLNNRGWKVHPPPPPLLTHRSSKYKKNMTENSHYTQNVIKYRYENKIKLKMLNISFYKNSTYVLSDSNIPEPVKNFTITTNRQTVWGTLSFIKHVCQKV